MIFFLAYFSLNTYMIQVNYFIILNYWKKNRKKCNAIVIIVIINVKSNKNINELYIYRYKKNRFKKKEEKLWIK